MKSVSKLEGLRAIYGMHKPHGQTAFLRRKGLHGTWVRGKDRVDIPKQTL